MNESNKTNSSVYETRQVTHYEVEAEISLFDLWSILSRRRLVMVLVTIAVFSLTVLLVVVYPREYAYVSAIEIGSFIRPSESGGAREPIQPPSALKQRLEASLIPLARQQIESSGERAPPVTVAFQDNTDVLQLKTIAPISDKAEVEALHTTITGFAEELHDTILSTIKPKLELTLKERSQELAFIRDSVVERSRIEPLQEALANAKRQLSKISTDYQSERIQLENAQQNLTLNLADLKDEREFLTGQRERLTKERSLVSEQLKQGQKTLQDLFSTRNQANVEATKSPQAMSLLMMSTQIAQVQSRLDGLRQRIEIELPRQTDEFNNRLADNTREQVRVRNDKSAIEKDLITLQNDFELSTATQNSEITAASLALEEEKLNYQRSIEMQDLLVQEAQQRLSEMVPTRVAYSAMQSFEPSGLGTLTILAIGGVLACMLGVFSAFAVEFVNRANTYVNESRQLSPP